MSHIIWAISYGSSYGPHHNHMAENPREKKNNLFAIGIFGFTGGALDCQSCLPCFTEEISAVNSSAANNISELMKLSGSQAADCNRCQFCKTEILHGCSQVMDSRTLITCTGLVDRLSVASTVRVLVPAVRASLDRSSAQVCKIWNQ